MKIAILAPHPSPLVIGGAENLFWGLQEALSQAGHVCDVIGQISPERSLPEVLTSYLAFAQLDLSGYDCVISGKYPAWMAPHRDHRLYLLHRLRGLYDTYSGPSLSPELASLPAVAALRPGGASAPLSTDMSVVRASVEALLAAGEAVLPPGAFAYPGPLARELVHALDGCALNSRRITRFAAISRTVAQRADYVPRGSAVGVLYPPPHRNDYSCGKADYFFTSSRLDRPKRIDLLIKAMALTTIDVPLLIAGTGPDRERLEALAQGDARIRFLGFVPDDEMPRLYRDALAVPFVPYDEDYGLVTIEAMKSGKPVLTTHDAGGPCEFVDQDRTGLSCAPTPEAVAAGLERLASAREQSVAMGQAAAKKVEAVTWERVVEGLTGPVSRSRIRPVPRRKKIVVATTMPIYPPQGGGQARVFHLYRHLAKTIDVSIVSFGTPGDAVAQTEIAPGLVEIRVDKSPAHDRLERRLMTAMDEIPVTDVIMPQLSALTPAYRVALEKAGRDCDAFVACHPYLMNEIEAVSRGQPLWFEAQDVEYSLKQQAFARLQGHEAVLAEVEAIERRCWSRARFVYGCTSADLNELERLYGKTRALICEVPNGVALDEIAFTPPAARLAARKALGFPKQTMALFLGSWHSPNLEAVEAILKFAAGLPSVTFLVAGSAGLPFKSRPRPDNVRLLGPVSYSMRAVLLASADIALNPMVSGTGSNLKMLDYFAAGVPVLSTAFGARGLAVEPHRHAFVSPIDQFPSALAEFPSMDRGSLTTMIEAAYDLALTRYSWASVAQDLLQTIETHRLFER